jgi:MarR family transcriptional regulator, organic hydroperoxide resistance regulator
MSHQRMQIHWVSMSAKRKLTAKQSRQAGKPKSQTIFVHLDDYLPYLINRVGNILVQLFSRDLAPFRLSVPMWRVIAVLAERGEQRLIDLSIMTSIDASTLSRLTETMQRKQLVVRQRSPHSKREVVVSIAARGVELVNVLGPVARAYEREMTAGLAASDLASTRRALRGMFDRLAKLRARAAHEMTEARRQKPLFGRTGKLSGSVRWSGVDEAIDP